MSWPGRREERQLVLRVVSIYTLDYQLDLSNCLFFPKKYVHISFITSVLSHYVKWLHKTSDLLLLYNHR